jgi:hypothetical protein
VNITERRASIATSCSADSSAPRSVGRDGIYCAGCVTPPYVEHTAWSHTVVWKIDVRIHVAALIVVGPRGCTSITPIVRVVRFVHGGNSRATRIAFFSSLGFRPIDTPQLEDGSGRRLAVEDELLIDDFALVFIVVFPPVPGDHAVPSPPVDVTLFASESTCTTHVDAFLRRLDDAQLVPSNGEQCLGSPVAGTSTARPAQQPRASDAAQSRQLTRRAP